MNIEEVALKLQETTDRSVRNEGRIKKLESVQESIHSLATSVAIMTEQMKSMNSSVHTLTDKVEELEQKPAKKWEGVVDKVLWAFLAAVIAFLLGRMGL